MFAALFSILSRLLSLLKVLRSFIQGVWCCIIFVFVSIVSPSTSASIQALGQYISLYSYPVELHQVKTKDGYLLVLFRIPRGKPKKDESEERTYRPAVLLMHGLLDSAFTWIVNGPEKSLAFILADQGYDVWLGNNRGTVYGNKHLYLEQANEEFWRFSFDEMAKFDLPDTIDYVLRQTGQKKLSLIGHSEGTTQTFAALSETPELASKLYSFTALGPVASVGHTQNPFVRTLAKYRLDIVISFLLREKSFMCFPVRSFTRFGLAVLCRAFPFLVDDVVSLLCGKPERPFDISKELEWAQNEPGGTSLMNLKHWCQAVRSGVTFLKYDYGRKMNLKFYGQETPPVYNLQRIPKQLPKLLIYGTVDELVNPVDLSYLVSNISSSQLILTEAVNYNHCDYLWDDDAVDEIYPNVLNFVRSNIR